MQNCLIARRSLIGHSIARNVTMMIVFPR